MPFSLLYGPGPGDGCFAPFRPVGVVIDHPQSAGEESRTPIVGMDHHQFTILIYRTRNHFPSGCIIGVVACLRGAFHRILQLRNHLHHGIIYLAGLKIEKVEGIGIIKDTIAEIFFSKIFAFWIQELPAVKILQEFLLLPLHSGNLLIFPFGCIFPHIAGKEIKTLPYASAVG